MRWLKLAIALYNYSESAKKNGLLKSLDQFAVFDESYVAFLNLN